MSATFYLAACSMCGNMTHPPALDEESRMIQIIGEREMSKRGNRGIVWRWTDEGTVGWICRPCIDEEWLPPARYDYASWAARNYKIRLQ